MGELAEVRKMADRPLNELLSRDMVDIYVGPSSTHWILHEKLLCARSSFFRKTFYTSPKSRKSSSSSTSSASEDDDTPAVKPSTDDKSPATKSVGLPDDDDAAFQAFVAWLYAAALPPAAAESDLTVLLELYLMSERWGVPALQARTMEAVRGYYRETDTYPGLRRVQYVYANTSEGSAMREFLVGSVARMLVIGGQKTGAKKAGGMPAHWEKALRKNGFLAVDLLGKVREWGLDARKVPDVRQEEGEVEEEDDEGEVESEGEDEVKQENEDEEEQSEEKQIHGEGDEFNQNALDQELPNGLVNGV